MNDSGNAPELFALNTQGDDLGTWTLGETVQSDWEALSDFVLRGPLPLIADVVIIFDGSRSFFDCCKRARFGQPEERTISEEWRMISPILMVCSEIVRLWRSTKKRSSLVVDEESSSSELYSLPLKGFFFCSCQKISDLFPLPRATYADVKEEPGIGKYRRMVTGMDVSEDDLYLLPIKIFICTSYPDLKRVLFLGRMPLKGKERPWH
ncbi:MAG: hypothetical protein Ct9H90mP27_7440 [Gammaproteobacteria bacterium]|nr:MAG: hypothetical protein Ct9H90mP27_7440 [Gammaproteobacteria bacterium]